MEQELGVDFRQVVPGGFEVEGQRDRGGRGGVLLVTTLSYLRVASVSLPYLLTSLLFLLPLQLVVYHLHLALFEVILNGTLSGH